MVGACDEHERKGSEFISTWRQFVQLRAYTLTPTSSLLLYCEAAHMLTYSSNFSLNFDLSGHTEKRSKVDIVRETCYL